MSWNIEKREGAVVVTMRSNPVNKMNPEFFDDLHAALDAIERDHPGTPMVLTAEGSTFSAGLDFEDVFPRFARNDVEELGRWFGRFRSSILRVFDLPRRTVAAVNGNAFAGGLILAACCDVRVGVEGRGRFAINEIAVGIPMPATYTEIVRYAVGTPAAAEAILDCRVYDVEGARAAGFLNRVVPADRLIEEAVRAARVPENTGSAYAASKKILHAPTRKWMETEGAALDLEAMRAVMAEDSVKAQAAALARLKKKG